MLLGGLWHGAGWTFVAWGGLHGIGQVAGRWRRRRRTARGLPAEPTSAARILLARLTTFHLVCLAWVFFRADSIDAALGLLGRLATAWGESAPLATPLVAGTIVGMLLLQNLPLSRASERLQGIFSRAGPILQGASLAVVLVVITALGSRGVAPFIYFQF
jgi:hypothetical protein